jgi:putative salt-induced outer membrane protein
MIFLPNKNPDMKDKLKLDTYANIAGAWVCWFATSSALGQATDASTLDPNKPLWESSVAFGLALTRGNSDTLLINGNIQSSRKWDRNELNLGASLTYGENDGDRNADSQRGYAQYNRLFTERWFGYARVEALHDGIADIDYRVTISPGVGYYFIKNEKTAARAEIGPGYVFERVGDDDNDFFTLRLAERLDHKFNDAAKLWQSVEFLPKVDDWSYYIVNAELGVETAITKKLKLRAYLQDTYTSEPAPDREHNDLKLVTEIAYKF